MPARVGVLQCPGKRRLCGDPRPRLASRGGPRRRRLLRRCVHSGSPDVPGTRPWRRVGKQVGGAPGSVMRRPGRGGRSKGGELVGDGCKRQHRDYSARTCVRHTVVGRKVGATRPAFFLWWYCVRSEGPVQLPVRGRRSLRDERRLAYIDGRTWTDLVASEAVDRPGVPASRPRLTGRQAVLCACVPRRRGRRRRLTAAGARAARLSPREARGRHRHRPRRRVGDSRTSGKR